MAEVTLFYGSELCHKHIKVILTLCYFDRPILFDNNHNDDMRCLVIGMRELMRRWGLCCLAITSLCGSILAAQGEDKDLPAVHAEQVNLLPYVTDIVPADDTAVSDNMAAVSQLKALQKTRNVGAYALAGRIRADYARLQGALQSRGYYAGHVTITVKIAGKSLDGQAPNLAGFLAAAPQGETAHIQLKAFLGPQFTIRKIIFLPANDAAMANQLATAESMEGAGDVKPSVVGSRSPLSEGERKALGLSEGAPAVAGDILAIQGRLFSYMQEEGYAFSDVQTPQVVLHAQQRQVDVLVKLSRGPKLVIGPMSFNGLGRVRTAYIKRRLTLKEGQLYQPSAIEQARLDLGSTGIFSSVQERNADKSLPLTKVEKTSHAHSKAEPMPKGVEGALPLTFDFNEKKRHRLTGDVGYSTDLGGRAGVTWLHRNLLGNGEQLRVTTLATGLGGTAQQGLGYDAYVDFLKPDFLQRSQTLNLRIEGIRQLLYSYGQTAFLLHGGIARPLSKDISGSLGATIEQEHIRQFGAHDQYFIASLPFQLDYDGTHRTNPIEPATHGVKVSLGVTPSVSLEHKTSFYIPMSAQISTYLDFTHLGLTKPGMSILALRVMAGSVQGASTWNLPPDQRLYAGGPGSIRGFRYQGVGPQYGGTKYAIGGTAMDAGTAEFRQRLPKNFGLAAFVDAGQVSSGSVPGHGTVRVGYGGGVRYFTPIGPVRVDVALPMNRPYRGDKWELYFGLGETF